MKGRIQHVCLMLLGSLLGLFAVAQVPDAVLRTFATTYPQADKVQWSEQQRYHEAHFWQADQQSIAVFDPIGTAIATGQVLPADSLPDHIAQQLRDNYGEGLPSHIERLQYLNGGVLYRCTWREGPLVIVVERDALGMPVGPADEG